MKLPFITRAEPIFCESRFGGLKTANRRFEAIRANRSRIMKIGRESPRFALRIAGPSKLDKWELQIPCCWQALGLMTGSLLETLCAPPPSLYSAECIHHVMWSFPAKIWPQKALIDHITWRPWAFKTSTFGITWCDNFWPNVWLKVAEGFHIRWRMLAAHLPILKIMQYSWFVNTCS